jgi:hypothetical protein
MEGRSQKSESRSQKAELSGATTPSAPLPPPQRLNLRLGLAQTRDAVAILPLTAFLEDFDALKALHDVAFTAQGGSGAQAAML